MQHPRNSAPGSRGRQGEVLCCARRALPDGVAGDGSARVGPRPVLDVPAHCNAHLQASKAAVAAVAAAATMQRAEAAQRTLMRPASRPFAPQPCPPGCCPGLPAFPCPLCSGCSIQGTQASSGTRKGGTAGSPSIRTASAGSRGCSCSRLQQQEYTGQAAAACRSPPGGRRRRLAGPPTNGAVPASCRAASPAPPSLEGGSTSAA